MNKKSENFGSIIRRFRDKSKLSLRAAAAQSGLSAAYWNQMEDGRVPSEQVITKISQIFADLDENELREAAGLAPNWKEMDIAEAVALYMRHNDSVPKEGIDQIAEFVQETIDLYNERKKVE